MMLMVLWLLPFPIVCAAPIHLSDVPGGSATLAVLLSAFSLLCLLLIFKWIYLQARKSKCLSYLHFSKSDLVARSSASALLPTEDNSAKAAAFFVGLFGSPAWETSVTNLIDKTKAVDSHPFSFGSYQSRRSRSWRTPYSSLSKSASVVRGDPRLPSMSRVDETNGLCKIPDEATTLVQEKTTSFRLPARPSLVYDASPLMTTPRRFSMPTVSRRDVNILGRVKRASSQSTKNTTIGHADLSVSSLVGNRSLRLVQTINNSDHSPLPLSPNQPKCFTTRCSSSMPSSPTSYDRVLQPLSVLRSKSVTHSQNDHKSSLKNKRRISHPFPLTPSTAYVAHTIRMSRKSPSQMKMANHVQSAQEPASILRPLSPVLLSIDLSPLSTHGSTSGSSVQSSGEKNVVFPKIKQKQSRKSSLRPRRSPVIGPSPLRAMILPDPSDSKVAVGASVSQAVSQTSCHSHDYSNLGLGFPSSPSQTTREAQEARLRLDTEKTQMEMISEDQYLTAGTKDSNTLVGMIRELVEETDQWDASLFKDKNFKAMIDDSKQTLKGSLNRIPLNPSHHSDKASQEDVDRSCEVDLNLLGLDIFRSGGETFMPVSEDKETSMIDEPHLIALWEDSVTWLAEQDYSTKQGSVGLAC